MKLDMPTCGPAKPIAPGYPQDTRRTYSWLVVAGIIALIIWSAIGTGADLRVFLHGDAWFQMASFVAALFPPDLSSRFLRATLWSGVETIALSLMGTALAVLIALPLGVASSRTVGGGKLEFRGLCWHCRFGGSRSVLRLTKRLSATPGVRR